MSDEVDALKQQKIGVPKFNIYELKGILKKYAGYKEQTKDEFVKIEEIILRSVGSFFRLYTSRSIIIETRESPQKVPTYSFNYETYNYTYTEIIDQFNKRIYDKNKKLNYDREGFVSYFLRKTHNVFVEDQDKKIPYELLNFGELKKYLIVLEPILKSFGYTYDLEKLSKFVKEEQQRFFKKFEINSNEKLKEIMKANKYLYLDVNNGKIPEAFKNEKILNQIIKERNIDYSKLLNDTKNNNFGDREI